MKFCYVDESGTGDEPYAVMVGIIVDAQRMRPTKEDWKGLLSTLSTITGKEVPEFHTRDFYPGNGIWRGMDGQQRARIISAIFDWLIARKHQIVYSAVDKAQYRAKLCVDTRCKDIKSIWQLMALHIVLSIQKYHQKIKNNKGNTVLVFDRELQEESYFTELVLSPPQWVDTFYSRGKKQDTLDQLIDVPHFADSTHVPLLQVADIAAYFLRRYLELENGSKERYSNERATVAGWAGKAKGQAIAKQFIYPKNGRCPCAQLFFDCAPHVLRA